MNAPIDSKSRAKRLIHLAMYHPVPKTWGDCQRARRYENCEIARCRYNLRYEVKKGEAVPTKATECCALAVAERGPQDYSQLGRILGMSRQRVIQTIHGFDHVNRYRTKRVAGILDRIRKDVDKLSCTNTLYQHWEEWEEGNTYDPSDGSIE